MQSSNTEMNPAAVKIALIDVNAWRGARMTDNKKCSCRSFHFPAYHKGKYFVGCNYYGQIVDCDRCLKCKVKRIMEALGGVQV